MNDASIDAYYFAVGVGASQASFSNLSITQSNPLFLGDQHSTFWVSSSMRGSDGVLYETTEVSLTDTTMILKSGQGIASGNGSFTTHSDVFFAGNTAVDLTGHARPNMPKGWIIYDDNYHGFTVHLTGNYPVPTVDIAQLSDDGEFGRFVVHTPGGGSPASQAPSALCEGTSCLTSNDVFPEMALANAAIAGNALVFTTESDPVVQVPSEQAVVSKSLPQQDVISHAIASLDPTDFDDSLADLLDEELLAAVAAGL
jgi:hypothetical protein